MDLPSLEDLQQMERIDAGGGGDCLFLSLLAALEDLKLRLGCRIDNLPRDYAEMRRRIVQFERDHLDDKLFREAVDLHGSGSQGKTSANDYIRSNGLCKGLGERVCRNPEEYFTEMRTDGTWGESLEIMTAAAAFGVNITVHVGERGGAHAELLPRETAHHFSCGTVDERRAAGLPDRVYGRIYLHSSDGSSQYQWKRPNAVNMFLGLLDDRNYERFQRALTAAASKQAVSNYIIDKKMIPFLSKSQMLKKESKEAWKAIKAECYLEFQKKRIR